MNLDEQIKYIWKLAGVNNIMITEGINELKPYFPLINNDDFNKLINLDPTYKGGDELGRYSKWILSLYNKLLKDQVAYKKWEEQKKQGMNYTQPIKKSQDRVEDFEKLPDLLKQFDVINKKAKVNINTLKSVSDLASVVSKEKSKGITTNSKANHGIDLFKKSVAKGGEVVFKDSHWIVLTPKTLESSVVFGEDTNWCTTSKKGHYYKYYLKEYGGKYFINLDLATGDLYQFHFESEQFMDANDREVEFKEIIKNDDELKNFYINYIKNSSCEYKNIFLLLLGVKITEKEQIELVKQNGQAIQYIDNPSEAVQLEAVKNNGENIQYIKNPSEEVQLEAIEHSRWGDAIQHIKNPSKKIIMAELSHWGFYIKYIKNPSEEMQLLAVNSMPKSIEYIKNPSEEVQLIAVKKDSRAIQYIKNPSEEVQLIAVKKDGDNIEYIKNPSEAVQIEAIRKNYKNIMYINNPSEKVQLEAINQNVWAIQYIDNPTEEMKLLAVKQNSFTIKNIDNPTEEMQLLSVKNNGDNINYIKNPSEKVQLEAVHNRISAIQYIKNPSEKVKDYVIKCIDNLSDEVKINVLYLHEKLLMYAKNLSEEVLLKIVNQNPRAIKYIKNPSEAVRKEAMK